MRKLLLVVVIAGCITTPLSAQDDSGNAAPRVQVFGGYSYLYSHFEGARAGNNGWIGSVTTNLTDWFGVEANFSGYYCSPKPALTVPGFSQSLPQRRYLYVFGPQFYIARPHRVSGFVHGLAGVAQGSATEFIAEYSSGGTLIGATTAKVSNTGFGMAVGGGIEVRITKHVSVWPIQADYVRGNFTGQYENDVRTSAGIFLRFGHVGH